MAIYFIQIALIAAFGAFTKTNGSPKNARRFLIFSFGVLILVAALRSRNIGTDLYVHYARRFEDVARFGWGEIHRFARVSTYEIGYCYLTKLLSMICPDVQFYIAVTSVFTLGTLGWFIYKNSPDVKMSTYVFILTCTYYNYMNIVRQAIAISLILIGFEFLKKPSNIVRNCLIFAAFVLLASTIHSSAVLCLILIIFRFLKFRKLELMLCLAGVIVVFVLYEQFFKLIVRLFGGTYSGYLTKENESVGHINAQSIYMLMTVALAFIIGCYTLIILRRKVQPRLDSSGDSYLLMPQESFLMYMGLLASLCRLLVFRMNIINRYSYFMIPFVLILYPTAVYGFQIPSNRKVVKVFIYLFLGIYFVWMTISYEASFHRTVPYEFFWQYGR